MGQGLPGKDLLLLDTLALRPERQEEPGSFYGPRPLPAPVSSSACKISSIIHLISIMPLMSWT